MSKVNIKRERWLRVEEAMLSLLKILKEEGFDEDNIETFFSLISDEVQEKRTIHPKNIFEEKLREIIRKYKQALYNNNYFEAYTEILKLFRNEKTTKARRYIEKNSTIITIAVAILVPTLLFVINLFIEK